MEPGNPVCTGMGLTLYWEVARGSKRYWDGAQSILGGGQGIHFAQGQGPVCTGRGPNGPLQAQSPGVGGAVKALPREGEGHLQLSVLATCVWQPEVEGVHIGAGLW